MKEKLSGYYRVLPYRWVTVVFLFMLIILNGINMSFYTPILVQISESYGVSLGNFQLFFVIYFLLYPVTTFTIFKYVSDKYGPYACVMAGTMFVLTGTLMRCLLNVIFYPFMVIGFVFTGISQPFLNNLAAVTSINWFPLIERPTATMLASLGNTIGYTIGAIIPQYLISGSYPFKFRVYRANIKEFFPCAIISLICLILYREKPPFPPA